MVLGIRGDRPISQMSKLTLGRKRNFPRDREQKASLWLKPLADSKVFAVCFLTCCVLYTVCKHQNRVQSQAPAGPLSPSGPPSQPFSGLPTAGCRETAGGKAECTCLHTHSHLISRACDTFTLTQNTAHHKSDGGTEPSGVNRPACGLTQACLTLYNPVACSPPGSSVHGIFPDKNTGVGCHALLQRIFPTQGSKLLLFTSPVLAGRFLTTSTTWEAQVFLQA